MTPRRVAPVIAIATGMDHYQRRVLAAARDILAGRDVPVIAHVDGSDSRTARSSLLLSLLERSPVLGVISMNATRREDEEQMAAALAQLEAPVVHVGTEVEGGVCVRGDNGSGMRELMDHLLEVRRPRRVALVRGVPHQRDSIEREAVFRDELGRRGYVLDEDLVLTGNFSAEQTYLAVERLLRRRRDIDAFVALNDRSALAVLDALHDAGLRVPEDVAVTGFDNAPMSTHWPGLTSVDQALEKQGEVAAQLLLRQLEGDRTPVDVVVPSHVVPRGSTAPAGQPAVTDLTTAARMARVERRRIARQEGVLAMSHALDSCWTVEDVVHVVSSHMDRIGVPRAFLALYERTAQDGDGDGLSMDVSSERVRLCMDHRDGRLQPVAAAAYPAHQLLPDELSAELERGLLVLQPLSVMDRPFGYVVFEQRSGAEKLTELIRIDLSRALDAVLTTQEVETRTAMLEQVVARRTAELQTEVVTRRRAERELQAANAELQRSAMLDGLTQLANRTAFDDHLDHHWPRHDTDPPLTLLMVDVDAFKPYNDHYGHLLGDEALRTVASCLDRATWGEHDLVCRYGGEEFAVVLPRSGTHAAVAVAQRFQLLLAEAAIPHATSPVGPVLTASIGIATTHPTDPTTASSPTTSSTPEPGTEPEELVARADQALYRAKSLGRDRIHLADEREPRGVTAAGRGDAPCVGLGSADVVDGRSLRGEPLRTTGADRDVGQDAADG